MSQDLFAYLPSDIIIEILSKLPAKTTMRCKCVCKPWLDLLTTPEFVKSHLSRSVPGLVVFKGGMQSKPFKIVEFVDEVLLSCLEQRWNIVFKMDVPLHEPVHSSTNGLLLLCKGGLCQRGDLFLCNPITGEYIKLPSPRQHYSESMLELDTFGFGVSKITGQYKVVRMYIDIDLPPPPQLKSDPFECQVYTIGTGSWRRIASSSQVMYIDCKGVFLNGNLHFLVRKNLSVLVSCLDLETELFSTFFHPPPIEGPHICRNLSVLRDCLCVCDNSGIELTAGYEIDIWLMKEYGDAKSWTKDFVIRKFSGDDFLGSICPVKVFKDGSILMEFGSNNVLYYYSSKTKTIRHVNLSGLRGDMIPSSTTIYAPSFLSLKTLVTENVSSF